MILFTTTNQSIIPWQLVCRDHIRRWNHGDHRRRADSHTNTGSLYSPTTNQWINKLFFWMMIDAAYFAIFITINRDDFSRVNILYKKWLFLKTQERHNLKETQDTRDKKNSLLWNLSHRFKYDTCLCFRQVLILFDILKKKYQYLKNQIVGNTADTPIHGHF